MNADIPAVEAPKIRKRRGRPPGKVERNADGSKLQVRVRGQTYRRLHGMSILTGRSVGSIIDEWTAEKTAGMRFSLPGQGDQEGGAEV